MIALSVVLNILYTCCDQLWYRSPVTKRDANKIHYMHKKIYLMYAWVTGKTNIDNTKWVYVTYTLRDARKTFLLWFVMYLRKLVLTHFKYITCKNCQSEEMKYGEDITFEGFLEKLGLKWLDRELGISHCLEVGDSIPQWVNNSALQGGSSLI